MISHYFGKPGCGKTTMGCKLAIDETVRIANGVSCYERVYTNFKVDHPLVNYIPWEFVGLYDLSNSLIIIDEATAYADSRDHKSFDSDVRDFMLQHRHYADHEKGYRCDIIFIAQSWNRIDKTIRDITEHVYYLKKSIFPHVTCCHELQYGIFIPVASADSKSEYGDIQEGYKLPGFFSRIFCKRFNRKPYYRYFDSWERKELPPVPKNFDPNDRSTWGQAYHSKHRS